MYKKLNVNSLGPMQELSGFKSWSYALIGVHNTMRSVLRNLIDTGSNEMLYAGNAVNANQAMRQIYRK